MQSADGKYYKTNVADVEQLFGLIQSIPSPKAEQRGVHDETGKLYLWCYKNKINDLISKKELEETKYRQ